MKRIISWAWGFVPEPAKVWVVGVAIAAAIAGVVVVVGKIRQSGYDACEANYAKAVSDHKDTSRGAIIESGKKYEVIKQEIIRQTGPNDPVGPRVTTAIDRLP